MQLPWVIAASLSFALMALTIRVSVFTSSPAEILFFRGIVSLVAAVICMRAAGLRLPTPPAKLQLWHGLLAACALGAGCFTIKQVPLAAASTFQLVGTMWVLVGVMVGHAISKLSPTDDEAQPWHCRGLVATGVIGTVLALVQLNPALNPTSILGGVVGFLSGAMAGLALVYLAVLSKCGEPASRTLFYIAACCTVVGLAWGTVTGLTTPSWQTVYWLMPISALASLGEWCLARQFVQTGTPSTSFSPTHWGSAGVALAGTLGFTVLDERLSSAVWVGIGSLLAASVVIALAPSRALWHRNGRSR